MAPWTLAQLDADQDKQRAPPAIRRDAPLRSPRPPLLLSRYPRGCHLLRRPPPARSPPRSDVRCPRFSGTGSDLQFLIRAKAYLYYFMTADEHAAPEAGASAPFSVDIRLWDADPAPQGGAVALVRAEVAYSGESTVFGADGTVSDTEDSLAPGASSWLGLASHQRMDGRGRLGRRVRAPSETTAGASGWVEGATVGVALIVEVLDNGARPRGDSGPLRQKAYYSTRSTPYGTPDTFTPFIEQVIAVAGLPLRRRRRPRRSRRRRRSSRRGCRIRLLRRPASRRGRPRMRHSIRRRRPRRRRGPRLAAAVAAAVAAEAAAAAAVAGAAARQDGGGDRALDRL